MTLQPGIMTVTAKGIELLALLSEALGVEPSQLLDVEPSAILKAWPDPDGADEIRLLAAARGLDAGRIARAMVRLMLEAKASGGEA